MALPQVQTDGGDDGVGGFALQAQGDPWGGAAWAPHIAPGMDLENVLASPSITGMTLKATQSLGKSQSGGKKVVHSVLASASRLAPVRPR